MENAAWAVLQSIGLAAYLKYIFGVLFLFFLVYVVRSR